MLTSRIEYLVAENQKLKNNLTSQREKLFRIEHITNSDSLITFYTRFISLILMLFFEFLGPEVNHLNYWGTKGSSRKSKPKIKLDPLNEFFLTLVKLRLNARVQDLAYHFGISAALVSHYFTTWICFLYNHLQEIDWMPTPLQVSAT